MLDIVRSNGFTSFQDVLTDAVEALAKDEFKHSQIDASRLFFTRRTPDHDHQTYFVEERSFQGGMMDGYDSSDYVVSEEVSTPRSFNPVLMPKYTTMTLDASHPRDVSIRVL